jgi:hypothetical protein
LHLEQSQYKIEDSIPLEKKVFMKCAEKGCSLEARGYEIEEAWDKDDEPVYAIYYECPEGHRFVAEYERELSGNQAYA